MPRVHYICHVIMVLKRLLFELLVTQFGSYTKNVLKLCSYYYKPLNPRIQHYSAARAAE